MYRLLLVCLLLSAGLAAQTLERSYGLELTPNYASSRITRGNNITFSELEMLDSLESGAYGYGAGLVFENRVDRIGYTTGLRYTRTGLERLQRPLEGGNRTYSETVAAHYLAVPFDVNFYQDVTDADRVLFTLGAGLQYHLGTRTRRTIYEGDREVENVDLDNSATDYRPFVVSFSTAVGYDRKLSTDYALRFQPYFQFFLNGNLRETNDLRANRNYYQVGLRLVVRRLFI
ncbi:outer membrane protein with beta-barrel domain [Neolewinella xylanilytica]|uniref:Outer membrane protein with beta-barrel domain n=1 Tax=Neolewinella xylanilytica TaxID=1514080 RepID=A0A2S6I9R6_9BACT|nr:outer membrane beta-barrel protein [Neolewinella xylanilytica]PPK88247.1 outer membrane protein with beta-barrel domain [Neolewinella xylanilytica]